jgi:hypothetical protein
VETERAELRRCERREVARRRRDVQPFTAGGAERPDDRLLEPPCPFCLDQLAAVRAEQCLRDRCDA